MPYNLLYTRPISSDDRVRFTDVPITSSSIMVDILSLRSPYYRIAGYAYSIVSDGLIDYERGKGYTLPFGKNRLLFPDTVLPYYLEFFPKWGTKQAIISVYAGDPSPPPAQPGVWKQFPEHDIEFRLSQNPARVEYRSPIGSSIIQTKASGATGAGVKTGDAIVWKTPTSYGWSNFFSLQVENVDTEAAYNIFLAASDTIAL